MTDDGRPKRKQPPLSVKLMSALIFAGMRPDVAKAIARDRSVPRADKTFALSVVLRALGFPPDGKIEWSHEPPLGLRAVNAAGTDYEPAQHDPEYLLPRTKDHHRTMTTGTPPGQKVVTVANGDTHKIAKAKRLEAERLERNEFDRGMMEPWGGLANDWPNGHPGALPPPPPPPRPAFPKGRKMQSRPFRKKDRP